MSTSIDELNTEQLKLLAAQEERSRTCAKAWAVGNEVPESKRLLVEKAYRQGWFVGGLDNVNLINRPWKRLTYFSFGLGLLTGSIMAAACFLVFG